MPSPITISARRAFWGLTPHADGRPFVMGILNVTPDSFSDGGVRYETNAAIEAGLRMHHEGADIIDVGGESTRPGAKPVAVKEELERVLPVVRALARAGVVVSIDTRRSAIMRQALDAGARIINDTSALRDDSRSLTCVSLRGCPVILMYRRGSVENGYRDDSAGPVVASALSFLRQRIEVCLKKGIAIERIAIDPGVGFVGGAVEDNLALIAHLHEFALLGHPIVVGASRKRFVGTLCGEDDASKRLGGSIALALVVAACGAAIVRVHDVRDTVQALKTQAACAAFTRARGQTII